MKQPAVAGRFVYRMIAVVVITAVCVAIGFFATRGFLRSPSPPLDVSSQAQSAGNPVATTGSAGSPIAALESPFQRELNASADEVAKALRESARPLPASRAEALALGSALAEPGYQRLDDADLKDLLSLRIVFARKADESICEKMWTGQYDPELAAPLIQYLSPDQQRKWARITFKAELAEIRDSPPRRSPPDPTALNVALGALFAQLPGDDAGALLSTLNEEPSALAPAEQCRATRRLYEGLSRMEISSAIVILRSSLYSEAAKEPPG